MGLEGPKIQIDTALANITERIGSIEEISYAFFECPYEPNYKIIGLNCYYFEAVKMNFAEAQKNCDKKFGLLGGHLAEPQTAERSVELNT